MFTRKTTVRLHDTDAAGVLYFGSQFRLVHETFEACLEANGADLGRFLISSDFVLPIVHAESDYTAPVRLDDRLTINLTIDHVGETSFVTAYTLSRAKGEQIGTSKLVHVAVDRETGSKTPLPPELRELLVFI